MSERRREYDDEEEDSSRTVCQKTCSDQFSCVDLVLNLKQIKSSYKPVSLSSRIFALDVETVRSLHVLPIINILFQFSDLTNNRQIPYWISVVDEQLNCVYQTLIKPMNRGAESSTETSSLLPWGNFSKISPPRKSSQSRSSRIKALEMSQKMKNPPPPPRPERMRKILHLCQ